MSQQILVIKKHHTSISEGEISGSSLTCTTNVVGSSVIHPMVVVKVNGHKFHAILDSGASHSYVFSTLIELIRARAVKSGTRRVAMLLGVTTTKPSEYDWCLSAVKGDFALYTRVTRIDKRDLLMLDNPRYAERIAHYSHPYGIEHDDQSQDECLHVLTILGANEYAQIRTRTQPRLGRRGEPVAEFTGFGWALMAPGIETDVGAGFLAIDAVGDYERSCALDVLGLADTPAGDQQEVYKEFREQLTQVTSVGFFLMFPTTRCGDHVFDLVFLLST